MSRPSVKPEAYTTAMFYAACPCLSDLWLEVEAAGQQVRPDVQITCPSCGRCVVLYFQPPDEP